MAGTDRPVILSTGVVHEDARAMVEAFGTFAVPDDASDDALRAAVSHADALIVRRKLPDDIFDHAPRLQAAVRHGVGLDFIPVEAATAGGVVVANLPDANTNAVVEHVAGLLLLIARRYPSLQKSMRDGDWDARNAPGPFELRERTLGIVGLGRIGRRIAALAHDGLGMNVVGYDPAPADVPHYLTLCTVREVFETADMITLHTPLTPDTRGFVDGRLLSVMKPTAWLINAARGEVIDDVALVAALSDRRIAGAALDVFDPEPLPMDSPYRRLDDVILTPHSAALTAESLRRMSVGAAEEAIRVLKGEKPVNFVNPQVWGRRRGV